MGETPDALKLEKLEIEAGSQSGLTLSKVRKWLFGRIVHPSVLLGAVNSTGQVDYECADDFIRTLRYANDYQVNYSNFNIGMFLALTTIDDITDSVDGVIALTVPAGYNRMWLGLTAWNDTRAFTGNAAISDGVTTYQCPYVSAGGSEQAVDLLGDIKRLVQTPGDTMTIADGAWQAGDETAVFALYVDFIS